MTTTIKRCKHCHKTYYYYLSGYHQYNNENYCPECQEIIEKALSNVPVKYTGKYQEITLSPVEEAYMATIKDVNITAKREARKK